MKSVKDLLEKLDYEVLQGNVEQEITELVYDSRKVKENSMFVCVKGATVDGHTFAKDVVEKGATGTDNRNQGCRYQSCTGIFSSSIL